ncbi:MAG: DUF748 domain-containing protein, partial [Candidatus Electrothrix sp. GM3_4]|nr:DUF748 domain-containing protein [Candidatus Electrothrix sp. GM3_4]
GGSDAGGRHPLLARAAITILTSDRDLVRLQRAGIKLNNPMVIHIGPEFDRQDGDEPALCRIATLDTRLRPQELLQRRIVLEDVQIKGMQAEIIRHADGRFTNLGLATKGEGEVANQANQALLPKWVRIDGLSLAESMLVIRDATNGHKYLLDEITFSLPSAASKDGETEPALHALVNGNPMQIRGQRQIRPDGSSATRLVLQLDDIDPQQILAWLPSMSNSLHMSADKTQALLELILPDNHQGEEGPVLSGTLSFEGLHLDITTQDEADRAGQLQCIAPSAQLVIQANPFRKQYTVEELTLESPRLVLTENSTNNNDKSALPRIQKPLSLWPGQLLAPASLPFDLRIRRLAINNGTIKKEQGSPWEDLQLEMTGYRNRDIPPSDEEEEGQGEKATALSFSAQQGATTVQFQGTTTSDLDLIGKVTLHNLDSSLLQPYLGADHKLRLSGGKAHLVMQVDPLQKQYTVTELTLDKPQLVFTDTAGNITKKKTSRTFSNQLPFSGWSGQLLAPASLPFDLMIQRLTINKGTLQKKIQKKKKKEQGPLWKDLQLEMTGYRNRERPPADEEEKRQGEKTTALSFSAQQGATTVQFQGTTTSDLDLIGKVTLHNLDSSLLQPYLGADHKLRLSGGKAHLVMQVDPLQKQYTVTELTLDKPQLVFTDTAGNINKKKTSRTFSNQLPFSGWSGQLLAPASLPFDLMIQRLTINKGTLQKKIQKKKKKEQGPLWKDLQLEMTGYRNRERPPADEEEKRQGEKTTALSFSAQQGATTVQFQGTTTSDLDLIGKVTLHNLDSSLLQPYLGADHKLRLSGGKAHLVMQVDPVKKQYTVAELTLDKPQLVFTDPTGKITKKKTSRTFSNQLPFSGWSGQLLAPASLPFDLMIQRLTINKGTLQKKIQKKKKKEQGPLWKDLQLEMTGYRNRERPPADEEEKRQGEKTTALSFSAQQGATT